MFGHGGSIKDPFETLRLYQSTSVNVPGGHLVNLAKWSNEAYDKIVDEVYVTPPTEKAKVTELFVKAMEIWLPELPDIPLMQFYHRLPMNTTYWTGYPTQEDSYINPAFFHSTGALRLPQAPAHAVGAQSVIGMLEQSRVLVAMRVIP